MITEETLKQSRFFRAVDENGVYGKYFMVCDVLTVKVVALVDCETGELADLMLGDDVCRDFAPVVAKFIPINPETGLLSGPNTDPPAPAADPEKPVKPKRPKLTRGQRNFKPPGSTKKNKRSYGTNEYEGVKSLEPYKDGRPRFSASIRIPGTKKMEYLGTFDSAKEASDARSKAAADMAEQAENNQERKKFMYVCKKCGKKHESDGVCADCGYDDLREVPLPSMRK